MKNILIIHRWLGVIACIAVLMFAGSGILHPLMSRMQPQPAQFGPPRVELPATALSLRAVLEQNHIDRFIAASLVQLPHSAAYRVQTESSTHYFAADTGAEIANGEQQHAEFLARHFLGDTDSPITAPAELTRFDDDYVFVNRLLPAWRIDFERVDGMRVYVDTAGSRLATLSDRPKRIFQTYFRALHDFDFLDGHNSLRVAIMLLLLAATFSTAVAGLVMYVRLKRAAQRLKNLPARRWHRRLSLAVAVVMFSFSVSGTWRLVQSQNEMEVANSPRNNFATSALGDTHPANAFVLLKVGDQLCYQQKVFAARVAPHDHHHGDDTKSSAPIPQCLDTTTLQPIANAEQILAVQLARNYARNYQHNYAGSDSAIASAEFITSFNGEYGFINKRLPVWRIQFQGDSTRWYVEPASSALALRVDDAAAREGWVFATLHKARFIKDPHKNWRDGFLMVSAASMMIVALLGLWLFVCRYTRSASRA